MQEGEKEKKDEEKEKEKKKEAEPNFQLLENPARVMPAQLKVLIMPESCRYQPFKPVGASGQSRGVRGPASSVKSLTSQLTINRGSNVDFVYPHWLFNTKPVKLSPTPVDIVLV